MAKTIAAAAERGLAGEIKTVFDGDGDAVQGTSCGPLLCPARGFEGLFGKRRDEGVDCGVMFFDLFEVGFYQFDRGEFALADLFGHLRERQMIGHYPEYLLGLAAVSVTE